MKNKIKQVPPDFLVLEKINHFFEPFQFNVIDFCEELKLSQREKQKFLSYLMLCIYYKEISYLSLKDLPSNFLECFLITLLAESIGRRKTKKILEELPEEMTLKMLCQCTLHMREGSFVVLDILEEIFKNKKPCLNLLVLLRNKYFDSAYLKVLLKPDKSSNPKGIFELLAGKAETDVRAIAQLTPALIDLMIKAPVSGFDLIEEMKAKENIGYVEDANVVSLRQMAVNASENWRLRFEEYSMASFTFDEINEFFKFYGLNGYILYPLNQQSCTSLLDIFEKLFKLFQNPLSIQGDISPYILFVLKFCESLHAFHKTPQKIVQGFEKLVYTLSTRGKNFSESPWLPSLLKGLEELTKHINKTLKDFSHSKVSIVVFDQSSKKQYEKNQSFISRISKKYHARVWHLSKDETLKLACALKIDQWIQQNEEGEFFGYGGARNCQFLLAPVIHGAKTLGVNNFNELMQLGYKNLNELFEENVLEKNKKGPFIHLGEDDVALASCHILSGTLFANRFQDYYCMKPCLAAGRNTNFVTPFVDLESVIQEPARLFSRWTDMPFSGGLKEQVTKPKFSLPSPFGNEELHVQVLQADYDFFVQPVYHLAGTRFPNINFPKSPLDGLEKYLRIFLPYSMKISLVTSLMDTENLGFRNILPWNDAKINPTAKFSSLYEVLDVVFKKDTVEELKCRFWKNFSNLFNDLTLKELPIGSDILKLATLKAEYSDQKYKVPKALISYYQFVQKDALFFLEFGRTILKYRKNGFKDFLEKAKIELEDLTKTKISTLPISESLMQLIEMIESFDHFSFKKAEEFQ